MHFFGKTIAVENIDGQFFVKLNNVLPDDIIMHHSYSAGIQLDNVLPLLQLLPSTGWEGLCQRELIKHVVLDRVFNVGDLKIPIILDVDLGRRFRLSTYREKGEIWACAVQLEQASFGIHYDLRVAENLKPSLTQYLHVPFRPRLVWQNDKEMMAFFIPLSHVDHYFKLMRTDLNSTYVDQHIGKIQDAVTDAWTQNKWLS